MTSGGQIIGSLGQMIFEDNILSINDVKDAIDLINNHGGDFEGKKDNTLISKAEKALGLVFPPSYKKFLSELGCGDIGGLEFYGLIDDDFETSCIPDAIWLTIEERKRSGLPENLILIYATGDGMYYALDTSQKDENGECPVISYGLSGESNKIADNYGIFLLSELKAVFG